MSSISAHHRPVHYCSQPGTNLALKQTLWGPLTTLDSTALYCSLSLLISWFRAVGVPCTCTAEWEVYEIVATGKAVKELNKALATAVTRKGDRRDGMNTNGAIVGILAALSQAVGFLDRVGDEMPVLTMIQFLKHDDGAILVHRQGLRALVENRGGIAALNNIRELHTLVA